MLERVFIAITTPLNNYAEELNMLNIATTHHMRRLVQTRLSTQPRVPVSVSSSVSTP